jgi:hypothetical protein
MISGSRLLEGWELNYCLGEVYTDHPIPRFTGPISSLATNKVVARYSFNLLFGPGGTFQAQARSDHVLWSVDLKSPGKFKQTLYSERPSLARA